MGRLVARDVAALCSIALMLASASAVGRVCLPYPFVKILPESLAEQELDGLIEAVVTDLENGALGPNSSSQDLTDLKYLKMHPSESPYGTRAGDSSVFSEAGPAQYFHAVIDAEDLDFFFPSACSSSLGKVSSRARLPRGREGMADLSPHGDPSFWPDLIRKYETPFFVMPCRNGISIRLYLAEDVRHRIVHAESSSTDSWTEIMIYRSDSNPSERVINPIQPDEF